MLLLVFLFVIVCTALGISVYLNIRAGEIILGYEKFYEDTLDEFEESIQHLNSLKNRDLIGEDDDFKRLRRLIIVLHDNLLSYVESGKGRSRSKEKENK